MILPYTLKKKLVKRDTVRDQWYGYLTPVEIKILLDRKKTNCDNKASKVLSIQEDIDNGISNPQWFYFFPDKELRGELGKDLKPEKFTN